MTNKKSKNIFNSYWNEDQLANGFKNGLLKGSLRLNPRNYREAYITHTKLDSDVLVYDRDINRALYDDVVAVELHNKLDWKVLNDISNYGIDINTLFNQMTLDKNEISTEKNKNGHFTTIGMLLKHSPNIFVEKFGWDMTSVDLSMNDDFPICCTDWWKYFQRTGRVVSVINQMNSRFCVGSLCLPENAKTLSFLRFIPTDNRYPRLIISLGDCPNDFLKRPLDYKDVKFIARIGDWNEMNVNPKGHLNQCLKNMPMIEQETLKILTECGFDGSEFNENILKSIPKEVITASDLKYRRDVRSECVFSIDPKTARDLDDALHIKEILSDDGVRMWEVGVHIADVTAYVTPGSDIDAEASKRTTTVYMVHKAVPMLPRELCENLCSLHPGTDKLAYSVIYKMTDDCQIKDVWIGRTIMRSACKLSYEEAQMVLDDPDKADWSQADFGEIFPPFKAADIARSVLNLNHLAVQMRQRRFENGSLWINQPKIGFVLNEDRTVPLGYKTYKLAASNHLIEEWMLQANITIAQFLHKHTPQTAFLRCHPNPTAQAIVNINKQFDQMGWKQLRLETGSTEEFQTMMGLFQREDERNYLIMMNICSKAMQLALYFCNNRSDPSEIDGCHHFALNVPLYTHFTSPIRRYPDVIVHRQITDVLIQQQSAGISAIQQCDGDDGLDRLEWMARTATGADCTTTRLCYLGDYCNKKKKDAKAADESSIVLFYSIFVEKSGPFTENGIVVGCLDKAFDVFLSHCGFIRRVYFDQLNALKSSFNKGQCKLTIFWRRTPFCIQQGHKELSTEVGLMSELKVIVSAVDQGENSVPKLKLGLVAPVCALCQGSEPVSELRDISTMQSVLTVVDEDRLYNILDDL